MKKIFLYITEIIEENRKGFIIKPFLFFFSKIFQFLIFFKNIFYDLKFFKPEKFNLKVISVGNIVAGGTGKTPFIKYLVQGLKKRYKIAIISRGYKSKFEKKNIVVFPNEKFSPSDIGDENFMLREDLDVIFIIGRNRKKSLKMAENLNVDIAILDDAFQNRKILKNIEIVLLNYDSPFSNGHFLPRGFLRENKKSLKRADIIIVNNSKFEDENFSKNLKKFTNAQIYFAKPKPIGIYNFENKIVEIPKNSQISIFCSIASPKYFYNFLNEMGFEIKHFKFLLDHEKITNSELETFIEDSFEKKAEIIISTHKDIVKLKSSIKKNINLFYLKINFEIISKKTLILSNLEFYNDKCNYK